MSDDITLIATHALELSARATPGNWVLMTRDDRMFIQVMDEPSELGGPTGPVILQFLYGHDYDYTTEDDNQSFVVVARNSLPLLAQAVIDQAEELARYKGRIEITDPRWLTQGGDE